MINERPILFNGEMVRAILDGRKTQTRRIVNFEPLGVWKKKALVDRCTFGKVGDRLWVRETSFPDYNVDGCEPWDYSWKAVPNEFRKPEFVFYKADANDPDAWSWHPSIHMPRWASRINLEITNVRAERLNEITFNDALKEGCTTPQPLESFEKLWNSVYKNWKDNPCVWVVEFKRVL